MTQLTRALSPDVIASLLNADGSDRWAVCIEANFGSKIADDGTGEADTLVEVSGTDIVLATSVDEGRTYQPVPPAHVGFAQHKIPGLGVGQPVTNKKVLARAYFPRPTSQVTQIRTRVVLENGDAFDHSAANADLESPGPTGVTTLGSRGVVRRGGRVARIGEKAVSFETEGAAAIREVTPTQEISDPNGTMVSRGDDFSTFNVFGIFQKANETDEDAPRFDKAAMTFSAWVYFEEEPTALSHTICHWATTFGNHYGNFDQKPAGIHFFIDNNGRLTLQLADYSTLLRVALHKIQSPEYGWAGRWRNVAFQYDGLGAFILIDGVVLSSLDLALPGRLGTIGGGNESSRGIVLPTDGNFTIGNREGRHVLGAKMTEAHLWQRSEDVTRWQRRRMEVAEAAELHAEDRLAAYWPLTVDTQDVAPGGLHLDSRNGASPASVSSHFLGLTPPRTRITPGDPPERVPYWDLQMMDISTDSDVLRICSGLSKVTFGDGREFAATGGLLNIGDGIKERGEVDPNVGMTFTLTGLDPQLRSIAANASYADRAIRLYLVHLNEHGGIIGGDPTAPAWEGRMDQIVALQRTQGEGREQKVVLTLGLKAESGLRDFDRPSGYRFNPNSHKAIYPDDAGLDEVAETAERQELWPRQQDIKDGEAPLT